MIWAQDAAGGIGVNNRLPWNLPEDLQHFKETTAGSAMLMGRATFDSLPGVLPGRVHHVLTSRPEELPEGVVGHRTLQDAVTALAGGWVIGGAALFTSLLPEATLVVRTVIHGEFPCDRFAPKLPPFLKLQHSPVSRLSTNGLSYTVERWMR